MKVPPTEQPRDVYVPVHKPVSLNSRHPFTFTTPTTVTTTRVPLAPKPPTLTFTASEPPPYVPTRVRRELEHEGYEKMPGRTRGETRALRDASRELRHRHGLVSRMDHANFVSMLATLQWSKEAFVCTVHREIRRISLLRQLRT